jgi:hypothetical protein
VSMSRTLVVLLTIAAAFPLTAKTPDPLDTYQRMTSVEPRCTRPSSDREILVCGNRRADRWRVPYIGYEIGDPRSESVDGERKRVSAAPKVPCGQGAIIADCGGGVGLKYTTNFTSGGERLRPLAQ